MRESRFWAIAATTTGTMLSMVDQTIANTALPTIARDVGASAAASIWVINAYQLALTVAIVPMSSIADIVGYARIYRLSMAIFVLASIGCVLSHSLATLVAARAVQGVAGAAMTMSSGPILRNIYPPEMLGRATGFTAMAVALGAAAGPVVSGIVLSFAPWQWLFALNIPFGLLSLVLATFFIADRPGSGGAFDWTSALLSVAAFGLAVFGFDALGHRAPAPQVALELTAALVVSVVFVRRELTLPAPMFAVDLFRRGTFSLAVFACFASFVAQTIAYIALPFAFQVVMGRTPLEVGLLLLPWLLASALVAPFAGRLADRFNTSRLAAIGLAIFALGLLLAALESPHAAPADVVWRMLICGVGYGLFQSPNNRSIQGSAPRERSAAPQGIQSVARLTGQTAGALIVAAAFGLAESGANPAGGANAGTVALAMGLATLWAALAAGASVWRGTITGAIRLARAS